MKQGFMLTQVQCQNCKFAGAVNPNFIDSLTAVRTAAAQLHKDSGIICGRPMLFVTYVNAMVSNAAVENTAPSPIIATPNGQNGS
jgi:hypothetical protein